jgi:hypothetical protein
MMAATRASVPVTPQGGGAAAHDSRHPDEIGHLQRRPTHLFVSGRLVFLPRG